MALFMFWGAEQLERIIGKKDMSREPKLRIAGQAPWSRSHSPSFLSAPSLEDRYNKLTFTRTETIEPLNADPIVNTITYTADQMLENRLVFITPAEAFKAKYNQGMKPVYLDVRPKSDYNLYHIEGAVNVPLERSEEVIPLLLSEPPANTVFVVMSNDETAAVQAWKTLSADGVPNVYILEGGVNNWIASSARRRMRFAPTRTPATTNWAISSRPHWEAATNPARRIPSNTKTWNSKKRSNCS
jgi:rhodanese-related sulfurtransferase